MAENFANNVAVQDAHGADAECNTASTAFTCGAFGWVTKTTFPSGYIETYGYDAVGNLLTKTDRKN